MKKSQMSFYDFVLLPLYTIVKEKFCTRNGGKRNIIRKSAERVECWDFKIMSMKPFTYGSRFVNGNLKNYGDKDKKL